MDGLSTQKLLFSVSKAEQSETPKFAVFAVFGEIPRRNPPPPIYKGAEVETFFREPLQ